MTRFLQNHTQLNIIKQEATRERRPMQLPSLCHGSLDDRHELAMTRIGLRNMEIYRSRMPFDKSR